MFTDFQYGDELASDYGLYVVKFDSSSGGSETISSGSTLTFNTVKSVGQDISELYGSTYDEDYPFTIIATLFLLCQKNKELSIDG